MGTPTADQLARIAEDSYRTPTDDKNVTLGNATYEVVLRQDTATGYQGVLYLDRSTEQLIIANRGTEPVGDRLRDLVTDAGMATRRVNNQARDALAFAQAALEKADELGVPRENISSTGHSLGEARRARRRTRLPDRADRTRTTKRPALGGGLAVGLCLGDCA